MLFSNVFNQNTLHRDSFLIVRSILSPSCPYLATFPRERQNTSQSSTENPKFDIPDLLF